MGEVAGSRPAQATAAVKEARLEEAAGRFSEAARLYLKAIELRQKDSPAWWHVRLAQTLVRMGDYEAAVGSYEKAIEASPTNESWKSAARELRRWIEHADKTLQASATYYDEVYEQSAEYQKVGEDSPYRDMWERIVELHKANQSVSILDIGCGPGQFAEFLSRRLKCSYVGLDFSRVAIMQASKRNLPFSFHEGDALRSPLLTDGEYDAVVCTEVLEHVDDDLQLLSRIPRDTFCTCSVPSFYAFGHVRYFRDPDEVSGRYAPLFQVLKVEPFVLPSSEKIFLFHGQRGDTGG